MDVTATTSVTTTTASGGGARTTGTSDYQTFLTMLTTQLKNQDPTSPMESADFSTQLATFSGVEQQTLTNQALDGIAARLDAMTLSDLSTWLGARALVETPVTVDGSAVAIRPVVKEGADSAVLVVADAKGNVVSRTGIDPAADSLDWRPTDATGAPLTRGTYALTVESYAGETLLGTSPVRRLETVVEAQNGSDGTVLVLEDGTEVAASAVISLQR